MAITVIVDTQTNEFQRFGHAIDARFVRVEVPRNPDPVMEKYSGNLLAPIVAKSPSEIAATVTARQDAEAAQQFDSSKIFRAKVISDLAWRLGKLPGALTSQEIALERIRILAIYKSLP